MGEEVTSTVKMTSDGTVNITLEAYHELVQKAAEKPAVVHRVVHKTPMIQAKDNVAWGVTMMGLGAALVLVGGVRFRTGVNQMKKLVKN